MMSIEYGKGCVLECVGGDDPGADGGGEVLGREGAQGHVLPLLHVPGHEARGRSTKGASC